MIICPPRGVRHFIGDQDQDTTVLRHTIEWELAPTVFLKDASMTRQEESACASTQDIGCGIPLNGNWLLIYPNCPPDIAYGCEAHAGSRVLACKTRGIKDATGDDALAGSQPARCPRLNIDGGPRAVRWGLVVNGMAPRDESKGDAGKVDRRECLAVLRPPF